MIESEVDLMEHYRAVTRWCCRTCGDARESYGRRGHCLDEDCDGLMGEVEYVPAHLFEGAVATARAEQREATIRYAAEWLRTLGRDDMAVALVRALSVTAGR